jgi:hypothetical protein
MTLDQAVAAMRNEAVLDKGRAAMLAVSLEVLGEPHTTGSIEYYTLRHNLAVKFIIDFESWVITVVLAVAVDPAFPSNPTDDQILARLRVIWDDLAMIPTELRP